VDKECYVNFAVEKHDQENKMWH